jgi:hypothetical protein
MSHSIRPAVLALNECLPDCVVGLDKKIEMFNKVWYDLGCLAAQLLAIFFPLSFFPVTTNASLMLHLVVYQESNY